jgi:hypothetical protein
METVELLCEGDCNPHLGGLEAAVRAYRTKMIDRLPVDDRLAAQLRTLTHTPHRHRFATVYACARCGTARTWGSPSTRR